MPARAFAVEVPFGWVTADEAYGQVKYLRLWLETQDAAQVLATKVNDTLVTTGGTEARAAELFLTPILLGSAGIGVTMLIAAVVSTVGVAVPVVLAPETRDQSLAEASSR